MDIEGAEELALAGMKRIIKNKRLRAVFVEYDEKALSKRGKTPEDLLSPLLKAGFKYKNLDGYNYLCARN